MANTFTTNYGLTKSEIGANNDNWGTDLNNALSSVDTQINRKVDKADIVTQTSNKIAFAGTTITANSTTASTIFENFKAGDVISIAGSSNGANNGNHTISSKTNAYTLVTSTSFTTEAEGANTLSSHLVPKYSEVDIDGGTIDGADVTVGSGKTLNVSAGTLTTSTAQKQAIVDGATIEAQDLTSASGTTLHSNITSNITTLGVVTSGTINNTVTQDGVVRLIKIAQIQIDENPTVDTTNEYVPHNAFSVPVVSGKTYLVETNVSMKLRDTNSSGIVSSLLRLYADTTDRSKGDNAVTSSTQAYSGMLSMQTIYLQSGTDVNCTLGGINLKGAFTAGSTETRYIYFTHSMASATDRVYPEYMSNYIKQVYFVYEVTGVSITTNP